MWSKINMNSFNNIKNFIEDLWWDLHWKATEIIDNWKYRKEMKALEVEEIEVKAKKKKAKKKTKKS